MRTRAAEVARRVLAAEGIDAGELGLVFVAPDESRALKREHLGIDEATDALAFPLDAREALPDGVPRQLGDVVAVPAGRRRGVARAARARRAAPPRLRPRRRDGRARGRSLVSVTTPPRKERDRRPRFAPAPGPGRAPRLIDSFNYAFEGIIHVLRTQRNLRIHFLIAIVVIGAAVALGVQRLELIALLLAIAFVLVAEMVNTAIEGAIDVSTTSFDPNAKLAKDVAAGAVLISAVTAIAIGYLVFAPRRRAPDGAAARPSARRACRDHTERARSRRSHRDRDEGLDGPRDAAARRASVRTCGSRLRQAGWRRPTSSATTTGS